MAMTHLLKGARRASVVLKALANERRLIILAHLAAGEKSVSQLERLVDLSQSALSQHLARLRRDGIVRTRRKAQMIFYSLSNDDAQTVMQALDRAFGMHSAPSAANTNPLGSGLDIAAE